MTQATETTYSIAEMNGLFRVYRHHKFTTGLKSFKTRRGAQNYIKRLQSPAQPKTYVSEPVLRGGKWCVLAREGRSPLAAETELFSSTSRESAYQAYRQIRKEQGKGL